MSKWTNEWLNERMDDWMNEWMSLLSKGIINLQTVLQQPPTVQQLRFVNIKNLRCNRWLWSLYRTEMVENPTEKKKLN